MSVVANGGPQDLSDDFDVLRVETTDALRAYLFGSEEEVRSACEDAKLEVSRLFDTYISNGDGAFILTGLDVSVDSSKSALMKFSKLLGTPLLQDKDGTLVREVRDRGTAIGEGVRARYADSRYGGDIHTDAAERPLPVPDLFTLFCLRQSSTGGALRTVHIRDLMPDLASRPAIVEALRENFMFDRRGDNGPGGCPVASKPVLFDHYGKVAITYLRSYIELGHKHPGVDPLSDRKREAMDELDRVAYASPAAKIGKMREGELALFDNLSLLHGRTEFQDDPERTRLLLRTWIRYESS